MKYVTPITRTGKQIKEPGAFPYEKLLLTPGMAMAMTDSADHQIVEVDEKVCDRSYYIGSMFWYDGRTFAEFKGPGGARLAQPCSDDVRAKRPKPEKLRAPRHEAPGVAPPVETTELDVVEPKARRRKARGIPDLIT